MLLAEYKSKELLAQYGIAVPPGKTARTPQEAEDRCAQINARKYVVKAQIAAGGRGLAGGVKFAATPSLVRDETAKLLATELSTEQTGDKPQPVNIVYIEAAIEHTSQYYVAIVLSPETGQPILLASPDGGMEFENLLKTNKDTLKTHALTGDAKADKTPLVAFLASIGIEEADASEQILAAVEAFIANDMTLLEINPFARKPDGKWVALDAKITVDPSASFRHPELEAIAADQNLPQDESDAQKSNINFVRMPGNLGVVTNGAGLGLATNDMIIEEGGRPANFMDIRTTATSMDIARGVELLLQRSDVAAILLNVHGGGMTMCDTVAEGVNFAYSRNERNLPLVARLAGQNAEWGRRILVDRKVPVEIFDDLSSAVKRAVSVAAGGAR
ncbi:MAG: ATP-grasp domain-containing protein [Pseudomonadota bacterium]